MDNKSNLKKSGYKLFFYKSGYKPAYNISLTWIVRPDKYMDKYMVMTNIAIENGHRNSGFSH